MRPETCITKFAAAPMTPSTWGTLYMGDFSSGVLFDEGVNLFHGVSAAVESFLKFELGFGFGFAEGHLYAAMGVYVAFAGSLDGQEDHVFVVRHNR